jgi:hypothetical protein
MSKWNRRQFLSGLLAAVGASATSTTYAEALTGDDPQARSAVGDAGVSSPRGEPTGEQPSASRVTIARDGDRHALHECLPEGLRFGRWRVVAVHPVKHGAVPVVLESRRGQRFQVDVLRRDRHPQAKAGVGETRLYALYLVNNGRGSKPTQEEQGVGLLWLAAMLRPREMRLRAAQLLTQRERMRMFPRGRFEVVLDPATDQRRRDAEAQATAIDVPRVRSRTVRTRTG